MFFKRKTSQKDELGGEEETVLFFSSEIPWSWIFQGKIKDNLNIKYSKLNFLNL